MKGTMTSRIQAIAFDAYGTLFDLHSVTALCDCLRIVEFLGHRGCQELRVLDVLG